MSGGLRGIQLLVRQAATLGIVSASESDPLHLVLCQALLCAIIELRRARALVCRHLLSVLQCSAVGKIRGDPGRPKRMIADRRENANRRRALADHPPRVRLPHGLLGKFDATMTAQGAEHETLEVL